MHFVYAKFTEILKISISRLVYERQWPKYMAYFCGKEKNHILMLERGSCLVKGTPERAL